MRIYDLIEKKKHGGELTKAEIYEFINGYVDGTIPEYQASALCMAIWFKGMTDKETANLTFAIRDSGNILKLPNLKGIRADKHSTGGVGDKTSLVVAPIVATLGINVAKMSGRGLGHTGGTVDKLESIAGFRTDMSTEEFESIVMKTGIAIVGQSVELAPADRKLYALRDVTATIDSMPLIASSIMGKKLAADDDCIVLDVKTGSGSFMKTEAASRELARLMVDIGKHAGKKTVAFITDMDRPLGKQVGNSLEVIEAIETLSGNGPHDLFELSLTLASEMLRLAGYSDESGCIEAARKTITDGTALDTFARMVEAQGGDKSWIYDTSKFPKAPFQKTVYAQESGYVVHLDAEECGKASLSLGAGRILIGDAIDPSAGLTLHKKTGNAVNKGDPLVTMYTSDKAKFPYAEKLIRGAYSIADKPVPPRPIIIDKIV